MKKYTIKPGDTLGSIAREFYNDSAKYTEIAKANNISDPDKIAVGQQIILPDLEEEDQELPESNQVSDSSTPVLFTYYFLKTLMPGAKSENISKYLDALNSEAQKFQINTPLRKAHFIAQLAHESNSLKYSSENLYYKSDALRRVFGKYFPTQELANEYERNPEKIANRVYANRMQNGDEASGDGWKYRGRGLIQLTGKENYKKCGQALGIDLINDPDQLANDADIAVAAAAWFWTMRKLNNYADNDDVRGITYRINGGYNGLDDRKKYLEKAKGILNS